MYPLGKGQKHPETWLLSLNAYFTIADWIMGCEIEIYI